MSCTRRGGREDRTPCRTPSCFSSSFRNLLSRVSCGVQERLAPGRSPESRRRVQVLMDGDVEMNPGPVRRAQPHVTEIHPTTATKCAEALNLFDQLLRLHDLHDSAALLRRLLKELRSIFGGALVLACGSKDAGTLLSALRIFFLLSISMGVQNPDASLHFQSTVAVTENLTTCCTVRVSHACTLLVSHFLLPRSPSLYDRESLGLSFLLVSHCLRRRGDARAIEWIYIHIFDDISASRYEGVFGVVSPCLPKTRRQRVHSQVQHVLVECQTFPLYGLLRKMVPSARLFRH